MEDIIGKSKSVLLMKKVFVSNMYFERKDEVNFEKADTAIERSIHRLDDGSYKVFLTIRLGNKQEEMGLGVTVCGIFELQDESDESIRKAVISKNTLAILFPYLRSQITLLTAQPDIKPIVLPAININSLLDNIDEKSE
ncbi:MAG TPA: preprotein translocase subunit SecB [Lachnospiraceae bacterium]|nr:preprotein translocase subunit SecB [Lachnospiraceae bacterium]